VSGDDGKMGRRRNGRWPWWTRVGGRQSVSKTPGDGSGVRCWIPKAAEQNLWHATSELPQPYTQSGCDFVKDGKAHRRLRLLGRMALVKVLLDLANQQRALMWSFRLANGNRLQPAASATCFARVAVILVQVMQHGGSLMPDWRREGVIPSSSVIPLFSPPNNKASVDTIPFPSQCLPTIPFPSLVSPKSRLGMDRRNRQRADPMWKPASALSALSAARSGRLQPSLTVCVPRDDASPKWQGR
jgi:hypothetical protein